MQEVQQYERPQLWDYGIWVIAALFALALIGLVVLMTLYV